VTRTAVALGTNIGDRLGILRSALAALRSLGTVEAVSSVYETAPVGGPEQGAYLNAVVVIDTGLVPLDLLGHLQRIEADHGRTREVRWGPRTLDLDVVTMEGSEVDLPTLQVPHPRAGERRFVLEPLAEIWPSAQVGRGSTAADALRSTRRQPVFRFDGDWPDEMPGLGRRAVWWVTAQFAVIVAVGLTLALTGTLPPRSGWAWLGVLPAMAGVGVALWAARVLGANLTALPQPLPGATLVEDGPYRYSRHPIYGGLVLTFAGAAIVVSSPWALAVTAGLVLLLFGKSGAEERALGVAVPGYREYTASVRWRLLPGL
jgi:2-amino-4-hydroxy-6-hydroxymethyldihydropteridine diphosphokinase